MLIGLMLPRISSTQGSSNSGSRLTIGPWLSLTSTSVTPIDHATLFRWGGVDSLGQRIDFLLSARRDAAAARRFFRKALAQPHTVDPRSITVDKNAAYPPYGGRHEASW